MEKVGPPPTNGIQVQGGEGKKTCPLIRSILHIIAYHLRNNRRILFVYFLVVVAYALLVWHWTATSGNTAVERPVNVYVVEEHHEVLQYWYQEELRDRINSTGDTLIHFDAHVDMSLPELTQDFPYFSWPQGKKQLTAMMQGNDVFIAGAIITGMIKHIIWIHPSSIKTFSAHPIKFMWGIGILDKDLVPNKLCRCVSPLTEQGIIAVNLKVCDYITNEGRIKVSPVSCDIKRAIILERVPSKAALQTFKNYTNVPEPVILDINEDYFALDRTLKRLEETGLSPETINGIHMKVGNLICAKNVSHERVADVLLKDYISEFIKICGLSVPNQKCMKDNKILESKLDPIVLKSFQSDSSNFCFPHISVVQAVIHSLLLPLKTVTKQQLEELLQVGFCLQTSPASYKFNKLHDNFGLCYGHAISNDTSMGMHTPTQADLQKSFNEFQSVVDNILHLDLRLVSISRSVRDGCTNRHLTSKIESGILDYLGTRTAANKDGFEILYDPNLLEGTQGWDGRYMYKHVDEL